MLPDLKTLYSAPKKLAQPLKWTIDGTAIRLICPLQMNSVIVEGLDLCARAGVPFVDEDLGIMLRAHNSKGEPHCIARVDWRPRGTHNNKGRGPRQYQHVFQRSAHVHSFDLNYFAQEDRMLEPNLPIAEPLDVDAFSATTVVAYAATMFNIDMRDIVIPAVPWQRDLFGGSSNG